MSAQEEDINLIYALRGIQVLIGAGVGLESVMTHISHGGYGRISNDFSKEYLQKVNGICYRNDNGNINITKPSKIVPQEKLEIDFNNIAGVRRCEASLMTKTLMMKYDVRQVSSDKIHSVFQKWGCTPGDYSYQKLY